jgi:glycosyltransferase involved in cell wall biosynthesis
MLLVSSLERGGAERQVIELANHLDPDRFDVTVASMSPHVPLAAHLNDVERRLYIVPRRGKYDVSVVSRIASIGREKRIKIIHAFLFDAEMVARLAGKLAGVPVVLGSERNTDYERPWSHHFCYRMTHRWIDGMIANSHAGKRFNMRTLGIPHRQIHVVHNCVDAGRFQRVSSNGLRDELGIPPSAQVVGMVANFKRQKRHADFFEMATRVRERIPDTWFICAGEPLRDNMQGAADYHLQMKWLVMDRKLGDRVLFLGQREDMPLVYGVCDVTVLTSSREGTPNVLLESMACEIPVVATNIADNAQVVRDGHTGFLVPLGDMDRLTERVCGLLKDAERRQEMGRAAREWVERRFSPRQLAINVETIYSRLLSRKLRSRTGRQRR